MKLILLLAVLGSFLVDQIPESKISTIQYSWTEEPFEVREIDYYFNGQAQSVVYKAYIPPYDASDVLAVMVCVGGLISDKGEYVHSDPRDCFDENFFKFADRNKMIILGVGFKFVEDDWPTKSSYQYAQVWSGRVLMSILDELEEEIPIDKRELYMFGISAGAQFSVRFATHWPRRVKAVAAHAAGGYDQPFKFVPAKFLITVGEKDNDPITRREFAKLFLGQAKGLGIDIDLKIIPGLEHRQTEEQNELSRQHFEEVYQCLRDKSKCRDN